VRCCQVRPARPPIHCAPDPFLKENRRLSFSATTMRPNPTPGVPVVVDGAHALGQYGAGELDVPGIGCAVRRAWTYSDSHTIAPFNCCVLRSRRAWISAVSHTTASSNWCARLAPAGLHRQPAQVALLTKGTFLFPRAFYNKALHATSIR
jgi:hypothetical protein